MSDPRNPLGRGDGLPHLGDGRFLTGALVGGVVTLLLTNEAVQRGAVNAAAHLWLALKGGVEETKERFRDAEAEIRSSRAK